MSKDAVSQWDTTAANNTDIGGISMAEGVTLPSSVNNAIREMMAQIKAAGFSTSAYTPGGTDVAVADGGTGISSYTAGDTIYATGTTTLAKLAKGTAGQVLTMNAGATAPEWAAAGGGSGLIDEWLPAGAFIPQITNGPSAGVVELSTNKQPLVTLDFDTTTAESAVCWWRPPKRWDGGTVTFEVVWTAASGSGGVAFGLDAVAYSNDDALDASYGTQVVVTDTLITANDSHLSATSTAVTVAGTPADADIVALRIGRAPANGSDTLAADAKLIGVVVHYTASAGNDA